MRFGHTPRVSGTVIVVGSLNLDLVVGLERMPNPGETVLGSTLERHPGGKGLNQAVACARLGARVAMVGAVGDDDSGAWLRDIAAQEGIDVSPIATVPGPSGTALIEVDATGGNRIVVVPGANAHVTAQAAEEAIAAIRPTVVLAQGEVPLPTIIAAMRAGLTAGAITVLNPAPVLDYPNELLALVDVLVPNEHEAFALTGLDTATEAGATAAARALLAHGCGTVVMTRGAQGSLWVDANGAGTVGTHPVTAIDTVAAGDAFCGGLVSALADGQDLQAALKRASAAGALATTKVGAVPSLPTLDEVQALLAD